MTKISVVLPTYNGSRFLSEALESILSQTISDFELIIIDDCSTDETPKIIAEYAKKDARIQVITNKRNKQLPASLNIGFAVAKGKYLTWTSDDNRYIPTAFEEMLTVFDSYPETDFVYADMRIINEVGQFIKNEKLKYPTALYNGCCIGACFLYRHSCFEQLGGYDETLFCAEDYEYWLRLYTNGKKFKKLNKILYEYRQSSTSLTATKQKQVQQKTFEVKLNYWSKWIGSSYKKTASLFKQFKRLQNKNILTDILTVSPFWGRWFYHIFLFKKIIRRNNEKTKSLV